MNTEPSKQLVYLMYSKISLHNKQYLSKSKHKGTNDVLKMWQVLYICRDRVKKNKSLRTAL